MDGAQDRMFLYYDRLGFMTPYYTVKEDKLTIRSNFSEILATRETERRIDVAALVEIISRYHCFGDRTLVQGVFRTPWMARPNREGTDWEFANVPQHGNRGLSAEEIAKELLSRLQEEVAEYCVGRSTVGILLSGGMDSRIAAGVLDYLVQTGQVRANLVALTWGVDGARDVVYAREIAKRLGWTWEHIQLSPDDLVNNIAHTAKRGCEYSPLHLHAMPRVREMKGLDCILAASFGDSMGRAEYSGKHVTELTPTNRYVFNWFRLLASRAYKLVGDAILQDIEAYRVLFPRTGRIGQFEIEKQVHYMRRQLNPCLSVIHEKIPLLQVFSSPSIYHFIWSLSPSVRNDAVYRHMLDLFPTDLGQIPWARTGKPYLSQDATADNLSSLYHEYGLWIRNDIHDTIERKVLSAAIQRLNVFNMDALSNLLGINRRLGTRTRHQKIDEILIWLAALSDCVDIYDIQGIDGDDTLCDRVNGKIVAPSEIIAYLVMSRYRNL